MCFLGGSISSIVSAIVLYGRAFELIYAVCSSHFTLCNGIAAVCNENLYRVSCQVVTYNSPLLLTTVLLCSTQVFLQTALYSI